MTDAGAFLIVWGGVRFVSVAITRLFYEALAPHLLDRDPTARPVSAGMCLVALAIWATGLVVAVG